MLVGRRFFFWNGPFSGGNCHLGVGPLDSHDFHSTQEILPVKSFKHSPIDGISGVFGAPFSMAPRTMFSKQTNTPENYRLEPEKIPPFSKGETSGKNPTVLSSSRSFSGMFYQVSNSFNLDNFVKPRTNLAMNKIDERIRGEWKLTHDGSMVAWYIYPLIHHKNQPFMEVNIPWIHMDPIGSTTFSTWRRLLGFALKWWDLIVITPMGSQSVKNHLKHIQVLRYVLLRSRWKWGKLKTQKI